MITRYGLEEFVEEVREIAGTQLPADRVLQVLGPGFQRLLSNRSFLRDRLEGSAPATDEICLHRDPVHDFVVLARGVSARRGKKGSSHAVLPHDHGPLWALYGVYEGESNLQRYESDPAERFGSFPGLRLIRDIPSKPGDCDAIAPHNMHLPINDSGTVILVVYNKPLESVVRRGYVQEIQSVVQFQGIFPPLGTASKPAPDP